MRKELKKILTANRVQLVGNITLDESLWNQLLAKEILNEDQRDRIILNNTTDAQIGKLLDLIKRGHDKVFDDLRQCLYDTNQAHVADNWLCSVVRSPGPNTPIKRGPSVEAASGNQKRPRIAPSQPSDPPSSRELTAKRGVSCRECPSPEKGTDSDGSVSPNTLLRLFQCNLDLLNESESADDKEQCLPDAIIDNLRHHANTISERLNLIDDLLTLLVTEKCMHPRSKQLILENGKDADQASDLVKFITKSHLHTYKVFLKFLQCTQQSHLFKILNANDIVISSIVKIRVELYVNSFVYNKLESLRQLYKQVQTDICSDDSNISKLFKSYHQRLEALSVDMGSMIIYVWSPCPDASTSLQKACDNRDLGQRIQSALSDITGTCLYDPLVIVTCIQDNDKTRPSLESQMSSLTMGTVLPKVALQDVAKIESPTASFSDGTIWRPLEEKLRDSGSSLMSGFCAQLSKAGIISPEVAFHVQDGVEEDGKMTRLVKELGLERDLSDEVEAIVLSNTGSFDLLLNSLVGVFGNTKYHRLLTPVLGVDGVDGAASKRARYVVGMILKSKRRFFKNGVEFCIRVVACSQQRELLDALTNVIGTRWLTSDDPDTLMAADILRLSEIKTHPVRPQNVIGTRWVTSDDPETLMALEKLRLSEMKINPNVIGTRWLTSDDPKTLMVVEELRLSEMKTKPNVIGTRWLTSDDPETRMAVEKLRLSEMKTNPVRLQVLGLGNAKYYPQATSLAHVGEIAAAGMMKESQHLNNVTSIYFKRATITYEVTEVLSRITSLVALCFAETDMGLASKPSDKQSLFWSLFAISVQYLRLSSCGLTSGDVNALLAACGRLKHLDISGNAAIKHVKVRSLSSLMGLSIEDTSLTDDDVIQLVKGSRGSLEFLNASSLSMSSRSCCDILNLCPQLREFYVRGDGLIEALYGMVEYNTEHIYLSGCSDSTCPIRYVLKSHSSINCITVTTIDDPAGWVFHKSANHCIKSLFVSDHIQHNILEDIDHWRNLTQFWFEVNKPWHLIDVARFIKRTTSLHTVGLEMDPEHAERFLKYLERPLKRLWLVVSKKEEYADVIEETEKRLGATPGMVQLVTDPDGLYGTYTRESGVFYTHLPDTLPNDFRPVIGNTKTSSKKSTDT